MPKYRNLDIGLTEADFERIADAAASPRNERAEALHGGPVMLSGPVRPPDEADRDTSQPDPAQTFPVTSVRGILDRAWYGGGDYGNGGLAEAHEPAPNLPDDDPVVENEIEPDDEPGDGGDDEASDRTEPPREPPFSCDDDDCPRDFDTLRGMRVHYGHEHATGPDPKDMVVCEFDGCDDLFDTERGMKAHHKQVHGISIATWRDERDHMDWKPDEPLQCPHCDREYEWQTSLTDHIERVHESDGEIDCPAPGCDYSTDSEEGVKTHYGWHHEGSIAETPGYTPAAD